MKRMFILLGLLFLSTQLCFAMQEESEPSFAGGMIDDQLQGVPTFTEIIKTIDPRTGEVKQEKPDFIKQGEAAVVKIKPTKPLVIERNDKFPQMSRFAIRDMGMTIGAGMCIDVVPAKK